jgi:uncharacterized membrane protein
MMLTRRQMAFDGVLLVAATAGASSTLLGWADSPVRVAGGLVLSMFTPGYALLRALFPRALKATEQYALGVPVSFVVAIVIGATLDLTPIGLSASATVALLWAVTVASFAVSYVRSRGRMPRSLRGHRTAPAIGPSAIVLSAVLIGAAALGAAASLVQASRTTPKPFTALSVDGANGVQAAGTPLTVSLDNEEGQPMQYDLQVTANGAELERVDGVQLDSGKQYSLQLPVLPADDTAGADVIAYRSGDSTPYRLVHVGPASAS